MRLPHTVEPGGCFLGSAPPWACDTGNVHLVTHRGEILGSCGDIKHSLYFLFFCLEVPSHGWNEQGCDVREVETGNLY